MRSERFFEMTSKGAILHAGLFAALLAVPAAGPAHVAWAGEEPTEVAPTEVAPTEITTTESIPVEDSEAAAELPDARGLVARHIEASGGEKAYRAIEHRQATGTISLPSQGIEGTIEIYASAPNRLFTRAEIGGMGEILSGYDGEVGWMIHPALGAVVLEGKQLEQLRHQANFESAFHPEEQIVGLETVALTEFDGRSCYQVKVTTAWEEEYLEYYDAETGLLAGTERSQASPMGEIPTVTIVSDYQVVDGVMIPMKAVQKMLSMEQVLITENASAEPVDPARFEIPEAIAVQLEEAE